MSTQSPLPQNDPLLIAFQKLKKTPEYKNAVNWTIKAENESQADGELWFAFAAGYGSSDLLATRKALKDLYMAVQKSRSVNNPLGIASAMDEAGKWF